MRVLMFKEQFAEAVKSGTKLQTIRPPRKRPINVNDVLSLRKWTGRPYASKQQCLAVGACVGVERVQLTPKTITDELAVADGFANRDEMIAWFEQTHGLPFEGVLIRWELL